MANKHRHCLPKIIRVFFLDNLLLTTNKLEITIIYNKFRLRWRLTNVEGI
jgi:hypothetical protein